MQLISLHLYMSRSSHPIISLHSNGRLYFPGISSGLWLEPVETASELGKLSPHTPHLKTVKTSSLLDQTLFEQ